MRVPLVLFVLCAALLSGCYHEARYGPEDHRLGGTLSEDFDDDDRTDLERRVAQRGAELSIMESFPMQFDIRPLISSECESLRLELAQSDYVTEVSDCERLA